TLPIHKQYEIIFLYTYPKGPKLGLAATAKYIGCSKPIVKYWLEKWNESKDLNDKLKSGQKRSTTEKQDKKMIELAEKDSDINIIEIKQEMKKRKLEDSESTIRRRFHEY